MSVVYLVKGWSLRMSECAAERDDSNFALLNVRMKAHAEAAEP